MYASCTTLATDQTTAQQIEDLIPGDPDGLVAHVAGPVTDGWRIIDVWETEEHFRRFQVDVLAPAVREVTGGTPLPTQPVSFDVTGIVERRPAAV